jgi:propionyl-CoA synthetase
MREVRARVRTASRTSFRPDHAMPTAPVHVDHTPYELAYAASISDPEGFWGAAAAALHWDRPWDRVLDDSAAPLYRWFTGGELNTCFNAIDRHVLNGRAEQAAVIYDSPVTKTVRTITYRELRDEVARFAGVLRSLGVERGDRVIIYMPMTPETLIGMYACARIGAVHSVVFGGFAPHELAVRIDDAQPKVVLTASCGIEVQRVVPYKPLLDEALALATHAPSHCVVLQRDVHRCVLTAPRDLDWQTVAASAEARGASLTGVTVMEIPVRMPETRTPADQRESSAGLLC